MAASLYFSTSHMKIIVGSADANSVKVDDFAMFSLPEGAMINGIITDEDTMIRYLAGIGTNMSLFKQEAMLVIDNNSIRSKVMDMPSVPEAKMLEFISREIGVVAEGGEVNDVFDYTVLNAKAPGGGSRILAVAVDRDLLQAYRNTFTSAGFNLKNINIGVNAANKIARVSPQLSAGARILAIIDERNLTLMLFEGGDYKITNKYRLLNSDDTAEWRQEIGNNISSIVQFHKGQRPTEEISAAFFAGLSPAQTTALTEPLSFLGIQIEMLDLASHVKISNRAASKDGGLNPGKYLLNLGTMLKGRGA